MTRCYRIQPRGKSLDHTSDDWSGNPMPTGHLCAYDSPSALFVGENDDWFPARGLEVVEFEATVVGDLARNSSGVEVCSAGPVLLRTPLARWIKAHQADRS